MRNAKITKHKDEKLLDALQIKRLRRIPRNKRFTNERILILVLSVDTTSCIQNEDETDKDIYSGGKGVDDCRTFLGWKPERKRA